MCPGRVTAIAAAASAKFSAGINRHSLGKPAGQTAAKHIAGAAGVERLDAWRRQTKRSAWSGSSTRQPSAPSVITTVPAPLAASASAAADMSSWPVSAFASASIYHQHVRQAEIRQSRRIDRAGVQDGARAIFLCCPQAGICRGASQISLADNDVARRDPARKCGLRDRIERVAAGDAADDEVLAAGLNDDGRAVAWQVEFDRLEVRQLACRDGS